MAWSIYRPEFAIATRAFREHLRKDKAHCLELLGRPLKKVSYERLEEAVWKKLFLEGIAAMAPLEAALLFDEWLWREEGRHVLFPVPGLLPRLYQAHIDVTVDEFQLPMPSFILAIPAGETFGGMTLPSCLVGGWDRATKQARAAQIAKTLDLGIDYDSPDADGKMGLFFGVTQEKEGAALRWSIPYARLAPVLACGPDAPDEFEREVGLYPQHGPFAMKVSPDEQRLQYRLTKLVAALSIYLRACPDAITDGIPPPAQGLVPHFSAGHEVGRKHIDAERARPLGHWREWHFRRYPIQRDGNRRKGVVFVTGAWVSGREQLHTVTEKKEI